MRPPDFPARDDTTERPRPLARYTPDSRRWRRVVAALSAVGAPLAAYGAMAVISGVKSGLVYNLLILVLGLLALTLPAVTVASLLAPDSGVRQSRRQSAVGRTETKTRDVARTRRGGVDTRSTTGEPALDAETLLKRRYAAGEIDHAEFERRLDAVVDPPVGDRGSNRETDEGDESNAKSREPSREVH